MKRRENLKESMTRLALEAVAARDGERMQQCLDRGADPQPLLLKTVDLKDVNIFKRLIRLKTDITTVPFEKLKAAGYEFLEIAADKGHCVQEFLAYAVQEKNLRYIRVAVDNGADIHGKHGNPPRSLFYTAMIMPPFKQDIAEYFMSHGADINEQDGDKKTLLHHALLNGAWTSRSFEYADAPQPLAFLLNNGADPMICDKEGRSAFDIVEANKSENFKLYKKAINTLMLRAVRPVEDFEPEKAAKTDKTMPTAKSIAFKPKT